MKINTDFIVKGLLVANEKKALKRLAQLVLSSMSWPARVILSGGILPLLNHIGEGSFARLEVT